MSSPYESFFNEIGADLVKTYKDLDQEGTRDLGLHVKCALLVFMKYEREGNTWVHLPSTSSRPYSLRYIQYLCECLIKVTPNVPAAHAESLQTLFSILDKAEVKFHNIEKTITIQTVYETRLGAETPIKQTTHYIDARHTVQQAVLGEYPLPGICKTVRIRGGFDLWDCDHEDIKRSFGDRNLYFEINQGSTVVIALLDPRDELPPSGPAAGAESLAPARRCPSVTLQEMRACLGESMIY
jgi:hypothetical protein